MVNGSNKLVVDMQDHNKDSIALFYDYISDVFGIPDHSSENLYLAKKDGLSIVSDHTLLNNGDVVVYAKEEDKVCLLMIKECSFD